MKLGLTLPVLLLATGIAQAQVPYGAWSEQRVETSPRYETSDDVSCMALYCQKPGGLAHRESGNTSERGVELVELPSRRAPNADVLDRLKYDIDLPAAQPRPQPPASEDDARSEFYKALHRHADGAGTIEDVEAAYKHLLPYRR
ncbi:MAG: hypothetical protein GKR90_12255 [Pseudomonadales bacterium]|nr:hypothetical protein [Pseudomonadales bacterium]